MTVTAEKLCNKPIPFENNPSSERVLQRKQWFKEQKEVHCYILIRAYVMLHIIIVVIIFMLLLWVFAVVQ